MLSRARFRKASSIQKKKPRRKSNLFLVEGARLVQEALASDWEVKEIFCTQEFARKEAGREILNLAKRKDLQMEEISTKALSRLADTKTPQGVMAAVEPKKFDLEAVWSGGLDFSLALDEVRDPGNLGTILRTADAFGVQAVFVSDRSVELYNPKVIRSSMGSIFHLPVFYPVKLAELFATLKKRNLKIISSHPHRGVNCAEADFTNPLCLVIGSEAFGVSEEILETSDLRVTIPSFGRGESLNASAAAAVLLYEIARQKKVKTK